MQKTAKRYPVYLNAFAVFVIPIQANKVVILPPPAYCSACGGVRFYRHQAYTSLILDVKFVRFGVKKWVTKQLYWRYRCVTCGAVFRNPAHYCKGGYFGPNVRTLTTYLTIGLRMSQQRVAIFLKKHKRSVERFFKGLLRKKYYTDTALKCQARFEKNRMSLFTFLDYDSVPWNNNNAEHAIKAFARLRRDLAGLTTERCIRDYLTLLSVCESCRIKGVSFLDFLRSGETDIDSYAQTCKALSGRVSIY